MYQASFQNKKYICEFKNVKSLSLYDDYNLNFELIPYIEQLAKSNQLESLEFQFRRWNMDSPCFWNMDSPCFWNIPINLLLVQYIAQMTQLKSLTLYKSDKDALINLSMCISNLQQLETLSLYSGFMEVISTSTICQSLQNLTQLKQLTLNGFSFEDHIAFFDMMRSLPYLKILNLSDTIFHTENDLIQGMTHLSSQLESIKIEGYRDHISSKMIGQSIAPLVQLRHLEINLHTKGGRIFNTSSSIDLNLSRDYIGNALDTLNQLETVILKNISNLNATSIFNGLQKHKNLTYLEIDTCIWDASVDIASSLSNSKVQTLMLKDIDVEYLDISALTHLNTVHIVNCAKLKTLRLPNTLKSLVLNSLPNLGWTELNSALKVQKNLESLTLNSLHKKIRQDQIIKWLELFKTFGLKLKALDIYHEKLSDNCILQILTCLPELDTLSINISEIRTIAFLNMQALNLVKLNSLTVFFSLRYDNESEFNQMTHVLRHFKALKICNVYINKHPIRRIDNKAMEPETFMYLKGARSLLQLSLEKSIQTTIY